MHKLHDKMKYKICHFRPRCAPHPGRTKLSHPWGSNDTKSSPICLCMRCFDLLYFRKTICLELHKEYIWNHLKKRKFLKCRRKRISFQGLSDLDETGKTNILNKHNKQFLCAYMYMHFNALGNLWHILSLHCPVLEWLSEKIFVALCLCNLKKHYRFAFQ